MMSTPPQLLHLLKLLDDDTPVVRQAVREQLAGMRRHLPEELERLGQPLSDEQEHLLDEILKPVCQEELQQTWLAWRWLSSPQEQLEQALGQLSAFLGGWKYGKEDLTQRLDSLADQASRNGAGHDARQLAEFLFATRRGHARLTGNSRDYYASHNSNLLWVLDNGMGNPISLCCIYMLVGPRLGFKIEGCNFPGHFLARVQTDGKNWLVDCFNRGRFMLAEDVSKHHPAANPAMDDVINEAAPAEAIIARVLRNLDDSLGREDNMAERQIVRGLILKLMQEQ
jgi:regulator of sirC expression with transglutaminase-like and TPR domain